MTQPQLLVPIKRAMLAWAGQHLHLMPGSSRSSMLSGRGGSRKRMRLINA
jgi:hypothetical protein